MTEHRNPKRDLATSRGFKDGFQQLNGLHKLVEDAATEAGIDPKLIELVKIRASQLNGCAYCVDLHTHDTRKLGETDRRLFNLPVWQETELFTEPERAALALAEAMTNLPVHHDVPDAIYDRAAELFTDAQLTALVWAIAVINTWNRFGVTGRTPLPAQR